MFKFDNSYANLPEAFYEKVEPTKVNKPSLIKLNKVLAKDLNLDDIPEEELVEIFSGNKLADGSSPIAQVYAGHQFGHFVPQLGDGRAILLGELIDKDGKRKDLQLKGAGQTRFSRSGDGRAWLGPVIREYIVSEAMNSFGIPSTRALAATLTGEVIYRDTALPGSVLTRVASSHIRVGTFEYFFARKDFASVKILADYVINRHYPEVNEFENKYAALLKAVSIKQAELIVSWMSIGFVHGVMNTDNMSISGETIDYGPCAFMDFYDPSTVFSSIDHQGRYSYQNQASICQWNLSCFANTLLTLIDDDQKEAISICSSILSDFKDHFAQKLTSKFLSKIGLSKQKEEDADFVHELLGYMDKYKADFTLCFRYLSSMLDDGFDESKFYSLFDYQDHSKPELEAWIFDWKHRLKQEESDFNKIKLLMDKVNPAFIPRNHRVEEAIQKAHYDNDFSFMDKLVTILSKPFDDQPDNEEFMYPPKDKTQFYVTYCGT
jgi:serine/tyrosine/threonine adenylyltransferase